MKITVLKDLVGKTLDELGIKDIYVERNIFRGREFVCFDYKGAFLYSIIKSDTKEILYVSLSYDVCDEKYYDF